MLCLSAVENVFELRERASVIVCPGIPGIEAQKWKLKAGDVIHLRCPDGTEHLANVKGLERVNPSRPDFICLLFGPGITKEMVPIGTTLWID